MMFLTFHNKNKIFINIFNIIFASIILNKNNQLSFYIFIKLYILLIRYFD